MKASAVNKIALNKIVYGFICFSAVFALYASTACRTLPPYRDSGELIATAATLGIAHSPGYPLYTITGKAFIVLGEVIGFNAALSMNLLSAAAGALAALLIFLILCEVTGDPLVSVFGSFSASFAYINWYLSLVAEMYTLSLMFSMLFLYLALKKKYLLLFFCAGLSLGNHLTVIFVLIPVFLYISYDRFFSKTDPVKAVLLFAGGFLVYLYLPVRASGGPFINWGDPSSLSSLLRVITRAAYGHTLDLVSREVTQSQVLIPQLLYFGKSLLRDIGSYGLLLAAWGAAAGLRNRASRPFLLTLLTVFFLTGPWFIYMARMPVNPHALAIIEVGYMVPVSVLAITASLGISFIKNRVFRSAVLVTAFVLTVIGASATLTRVNMKDNYFAEDYALNLLESLPDGAAVMMRKDHPLFSLWYMQGIRGVRGDVAVISKGLLPAGWYRDKLKKDYPWINWPSYINDEQFTEELSGRVAVYLSPASAAEFSREFFKKYELKPYGLVLQISSGPVGFDIHGVLEKVRENYRFRGEYITDSHYDFSRGIL